VNPLVDVDWLLAHAGDPGIAVVDCRWKLGEPGAGEDLYLAGHVPGAAFMDVDRDLAAPPGDGGRHPLPGPAEFERAASRAGIRSDSLAVAYDESGEAGAARLWWLLRHFGHERASILDGGLAAWRVAGGALEAGRAEVPPGDFTARPLGDDIADADEIAAGNRPLVLVDARAAERYRGEREPIDPVAGHIPGAVNVPFAELAPGGRFLPSAEIKERLAAAGVAPGADVVAYCGSGVSATVVVAAAAVAGIEAVRLYPGSWSEWCNLGLAPERTTLT
jgi:thiosulfate/3-mercaptopyruvate sulfurtransferase